MLFNCSCCEKLGCRWRNCHQFTVLSLVVPRETGAHHLVHWYLTSVAWRPMTTVSSQSSAKMAVRLLSGTVVVFMIKMEHF